MMVKRTGFLLGLFVLLVGAVKYEGYKKKVYLIAGEKYYTYYSFDKKDPFEAMCDGPSRYKVYVRGSVGGVGVVVEVDGVKVKEFVTKGEMSKMELRGGSGGVTKATVFGVRFEKGKHRLRISSSGGLCYVRIARERSQRWVGKVPDSYRASREFELKGKRYTYYEATQDSPVVVSFKNLSRIKVYSRAILQKGENKVDYSYVVETAGWKKEFKVSGASLSSGKMGELLCTKADVKVVHIKKDDKFLRIYPSSGRSIYFRVYIPTVKKKR